jgi:hypothetical protein
MGISSLLCAAFILFSFTANAQIGSFVSGLPLDPTRDWKVLETKNFEIIYDQTQKTLATKVAAEAERAHTLISPVLNIRPLKK